MRHSIKLELKHEVKSIVMKVLKKLKMFKHGGHKHILCNYTELYKVCVTESFSYIHKLSQLFSPYTDYTLLGESEGVYIGIPYYRTMFHIMERFFLSLFYINMCNVCNIYIREVKSSKLLTN